MNVVRPVVRGAFAASTAVGLATALAVTVHANALAASVVFFVAVLVLAVWRGLMAGVMGSFLATASLNFFFLPPVGTFHLHDPSNWFALAGFLAATSVASRLVTRERQRALEAERRTREIEALHAICLDLFAAGATKDGLSAATNRALRTLGASRGRLLLDEGVLAQEGLPPAWLASSVAADDCRPLGVAPSPPVAADPGGRHDVELPVTAAGRRIGTFVVEATDANRATLEAVVQLISLALEREKLLEERTRLGAVQASDALKTALLRAVSHDLSTPLTAIGLAIDALRRELPAEHAAAPSVQLIAREASRLNRRVENLLAMARLEAGRAGPRREPTPAADLFRAAREHLSVLLSSRRVEARVEDCCPELDADPSLTVEILVNLIENAHRVSGPGQPIELRARAAQDDAGCVLLEVLDRGPGISLERVLGPADERQERADGADAGRAGLGLLIASSFAAIQGGSLTFVARDGRGACARIALPAAVPAFPAVAEGLS